MWASLLNNANGAQWMNNPWIYFVFLALFGRNGGLFGNNSAGEAGLAQTIADNHNSDLLMGAVKGNADAISSLAGSMGCDANAIKSAIQGLSSTFSQCCCENSKETMKMGYENQIGNLQQTNALNSRIDQLASGVQTGFAQVGYATAQQTCELKTNQNENTQRIIDTMNSHWTAELQQKYQDARLEMSQLNQTNALIAALKA